MIDETIEKFKQVKQILEELQRELVIITRENEFFRKKIDELKGERLKFYTDEIRQTQVINGVHFDVEQLLVFSEYVENQKMVIAEKDKKIAVLEKELNDWKDGTIIVKLGEAEEKCKVLDKAFELACDTLYDINCKIYNTEMNFEDYFIKEAKEELGNSE